MKILRSILPAAALVLVTAGGAAAQATQEVGFEVQAINQIAFSGSPSLVITSSTAGSAPTAATASGTYAVTTNEVDRKITAQIELAMPAGVSLSTTLAAPSGGTSAGAVTLGITAQDVVTGISTVDVSGLSVTYTLSATSAAGVVPAGTRIVTYTITAGV